jgi:hypothetical protein
LKKKVAYTAPSSAHLEKPVEERFLELKNDDKDLKAIIIRLDSENYNPREIAHVARKNPSQIKKIIDGDNDDDIKSQEEKKKRENTLSKQRSNGKNAENNLSDSSTKDEITDEDAKLLKDILEQTSGINQEKTEKVARFYQARKSKFQENPMLIYNLLTGAGLSPYRAQAVLTNFLQYTGSGEYDSVAPMFVANGGMMPPAMIPMFFNKKTGRYESNEDDESNDADPELKKLAREDKKFSLQMLREDMEDRRAERKNQKMMNQIMTMMMLKMMNEQHSPQPGAFGANNPMGAFMFPEIEYAMQDGKILTDGYGNPVPSKMRYVPMTAYMMGGQNHAQTQQQQTPAGYDKMFDVMGDALKSERAAD